MDPRPDPPPPAAPRRGAAWISWGLIVGAAAAVWLAGAWQEGQWLPSPGWRLLAVFLATILALMLRPIPGGAAVLIGIIATVLVGALKLRTALAGYASPTVWLVLAAFFLARAFIKTGLARRVALTFIRLLGRNTLGLSYAIAASDTVLAGMVPSNAARVGGVILPITRSLAELYQSRPGKTAGLLGTYLMLALYQGDVIACALFFTGQAGNPLAAQHARTLTDDEVVLSYGTWFLYALAPAAVSLLLVPLLIYLWQRPGLTRTPEAVEMARGELAAMGPMSRSEWGLVAVFAFVLGGWILLGADAAALAGLGFDRLADGVMNLVGTDPTYLVALVGVGLLLLSGLLTWHDAVSEREAWDVFIWYGGLVLMGEQLKETGLLNQFARQLGGQMGGWPVLPLFLVLLLIYFYAHYAFASITAHLVALFTAFVPVLLHAGAPPWLVVCAFAYFANFSAGLTHYGTTPGPIIFGMDYVPLRTWWRVGFLMSLVNVAVWLTVGMAWWKLWGLW
jgi:DASS family divalent anion:Na+ symporter